MKTHLGEMQNINHVLEVHRSFNAFNENRTDIENLTFKAFYLDGRFCASAFVKFDNGYLVHVEKFELCDKSKVSIYNYDEKDGSFYKSVTNSILFTKHQVNDILEEVSERLKIYAREYEHTQQTHIELNKNKTNINNLFFVQNPSKLYCCLSAKVIFDNGWIVNIINSYLSHLKDRNTLYDVYIINRKNTDDENLGRWFNCEQTTEILKEVSQRPKIEKGHIPWRI